MPTGENAPVERDGGQSQKESPRPPRPFVSESAVKPHYEQRGYIIGGSRHKLRCRCYACQIVRKRAREKRLRQELFNCG